MNDYSEMKLRLEQTYSSFEEYRKEAEFKIKSLEDHVQNAKEMEDRFRQKYETTQVQSDNYLSEVDARKMKIDYQEKKLEEKYHLENYLKQLKENYEDLAKEKNEIMVQSEQRILLKSDEVRKAQEDRDEVLRQNIKQEKILEEKTLG